MSFLAAQDGSGEITLDEFLSQPPKRTRSALPDPAPRDRTLSARIAVATAAVRTALDNRAKLKRPE